MLLSQRQKTLLQALWQAGSLSRSELGERTGMRLNTVGDEASELIERGLIAVHEPVATGAGRPRLPLRIDPVRRHVLGVAVRPGRVELARVNLLGEVLGEPVVREATAGGPTIRAAGALLAEQIDEAALAVGLTAPGFIDTHAHRLLFSVAVPTGRGASLEPIYEAAGSLPISLANDAHALAARWSLQRDAAPADRTEDTLIVLLDDRRLGASLLINGQPNAGCVHGGNELGHTQLPVDDPPHCYCGRSGCIEAVFSSDYLARRLGLADPPADLLAQRLAAFQERGGDEATRQIVSLLALTLANAVAFTRVGRVVLTGRLLEHAGFANALVRQMRGRLLDQIDSRLRIDLWDRPALSPAQTAGDLVRAGIFCADWGSLLTVGRARHAGA